MEQLFVVALISVSSLAAYMGGVRWLGLASAGLRTALLRLLELVGIAVVFFAINLMIGATIILAIRATTTMFLSIYMLNDISLVVLSALQGVAFETWRARP